MFSCFIGKITLLKLQLFCEMFHVYELDILDQLMMGTELSDQNWRNREKLMYDEDDDDHDDIIRYS